MKWGWLTPDPIKSGETLHTFYPKGLGHLILSRIVVGHRPIIGGRPDPFCSRRDYQTMFSRVFMFFSVMSNVQRGIPKKGITNQTMLMYVFHVILLWFHFQKAFISYMDEVFFVKQCLENQGSASRISMAGGHLRISKTLRKDAVSLVAGMNSCEKAGFENGDPRNLQSGRTHGARTPEKTWVSQ